MNNPETLSDTLKITLGAVIALLSSIIMEGLKIRINRRLQVNFFKSSLLEDMAELCEIIHDMRETFTKTQHMSNDYLTGMIEIEKKFLVSRYEQLYLIKDEQLRKEIKDLYKKLNTKIKESTNKVSKLGEKNDGHNQTISDFTAIETTMGTLKDKVKKYKYRVFFLF